MMAITTTVIDISSFHLFMCLAAAKQGQLQPNTKNNIAKESFTKYIKKLKCLGTNECEVCNEIKGNINLITCVIIIHLNYHATSFPKKTNNEDE
jgi:hypothetical protein